MDVPSIIGSFGGFLFDESATSKGELSEIVEWKTVMEKIMGELKKEPQFLKILDSVMRSGDGSFPFMGCLLTNVTVKKMIGEYAANCKQYIKVGMSGKKNATKAASIRLQGNSLFAKKEYGLACKMFTRGLMFAKDGDEETPLLYANRSAAYFHLKQYQNALEDIDRAFQFGYGNIKPIGKLLIRKGSSLLALRRDDQLKELLDANMPANEDEPDFAKWKQLKKESENVNRQIIKRDITMSQFQDVSKISTALTNNDVFHSHEQYPWLNVKIDLHYDAEKGYSLVSKEEMKYGEIVALSKPFVNLDPKRNSNERCHYCMVPCFETAKYFSGDEPKLSLDSLRMVTPLACPECSNVLYCSEACRTAAWTAYHRFECSQMAILSKMDSKAHLALRMLYMVGHLEMNAPIEQIMDQVGPSSAPPEHSLFSNKVLLGTTFNKYLERYLTFCFLLKLVQMSDLLIEPKSLDDKVYIAKVSNACYLLNRHLYQIELNESMPFTDQANRTFTPSPVLSIDKMSTMLKHSCEATVATSSLLRESLDSNVKLLYATGAIPTGTVLTLAYDTQIFDSFERLNCRKNQLFLRYRIDCDCTRCLREARDCLDISTGVYYPIGCSLCGELMVRTAGGEEGDDSYRCSSTNGCNFTYSAQQMKNVYERVGKMMQAKRNASLCNQQKYCTLLPKVEQLKTTIESTASLLSGRSIFLAQLYAHLASGLLLVTMVSLFNCCSCGSCATGTSSVHRCNLVTIAHKYTHKALVILEGLKEGPGVKTQLAGDLVYLFDCWHKTAELFQPQLFEMRPLIEQVRRRYEALLKMTAYDTMVVSSLADKE